MIPKWKIDNSPVKFNYFRFLFSSNFISFKYFIKIPQ